MRNMHLPKAATDDAVEDKLRKASSVGHWLDREHLKPHAMTHPPETQTGCSVNAQGWLLGKPAGNRLVAHC